MAVSAPADKRFRRAHVRPARSRALPSWRTLLRMTIAVSFGGYALYRGAAFLLSADALTVTRITIEGNSRMSRGEVLALLDDVHGANMVTADLEGWRGKLLRSPWVEDAALRRVLPGTLAVDIVERTPMGIGRIGDRLYLIDQRGTVIDEFGPNYAELDLPIIDGLASSRGAGDTLIDEVKARLAGRLLTELQRRPDLARRLSQIDVSDATDAVVILKDDTALVRVGDDHFVDRIQSYVDLAPALRERVPEIDYVDLRFDERVYVRPQGGKRGS